MALNPDFKEFLESLNANNVRYLIVGGYAVAFHGHPRYTKDLDIWIERSQANATRLVKAINDFGFGSLKLNAKDFLQPGEIVQFGNPPNRIELFTSLKGVDFKKCFASRVRVDYGGIKANVIDLDGLKKNKKAVGRAQDLADLENLG